MENLYKSQKKLEFNNNNLNKLYNCLLGNKWIKISNDKYTDFDYKNEMKGTLYFKAPGSYFSKGTWFFFDYGMGLSYDKIDLKQYKNDNRQIILITVDEKQIYTITGKPKINPFYNNEFNKSFKSFKSKYVDGKIGKNGCYSRISDKELRLFTKKEIIKNDKKCKLIKTKKGCNKKETNCYWSTKWNNYNFRKMYKDGYNGFSINPYPGSNNEYFNNIDLPFGTYDSESLALFNSKPVLTYHNIGTIGEIVISLKGKKTVNKFINELCKRINNIES
jgi:hypothetical protein